MRWAVGFALLKALVFALTAGFTSAANIDEVVAPDSAGDQRPRPGCWLCRVRGRGQLHYSL